MSYPEILTYLYTRLPMYQRQGASAFKKDLGNIRALLARLDHPERRMGRVVHVGGTNGKGTVSHLIAAVLQAHGQRVGLYTSPHYRDFRERIKIDGRFISEQEVVDFVERMQPLIKQIEPSFFEITVAMAFDYFARTRVQWSVVEVGLGGRLDSTNVIVPALSVITNIGLDHTDMLGDTLAQIATEKAGIIKDGVPVVIGETHPETEAVFSTTAARRGSNILFADRQPPHDFYNPLPGPFAARNVQTAVVAFRQLQQHGHLALKRGRVQDGLNDLHSLTYYIGRWQQLGDDPLRIADSAHNAEGLAPVVDRLREEATARRGQLHIVLGVVREKALDRILPLFPHDADYYFVKADVPRGLPADELMQAAATYGLVGQTYATVTAGYAAARARARAADVVFVGGSIFTVAELV